MTLIEEITSFAESIGVDSGIVVGRLQHEGYLRLDGPILDAVQHGPE